MFMRFRVEPKTSLDSKLLGEVVVRVTKLLGEVVVRVTMVPACISGIVTRPYKIASSVIMLQDYTQVLFAKCI